MKIKIVGLFFLWSFLVCSNMVLTATATVAATATVQDGVMTVTGVLSTNNNASGSYYDKDYSFDLVFFANPINYGSYTLSCGHNTPTLPRNIIDYYGIVGHKLSDTILVYKNVLYTLSSEPVPRLFYENSSTVQCSTCGVVSVDVTDYSVLSPQLFTNGSGTDVDPRASFFIVPPNDEFSVATTPLYECVATDHYTSVLLKNVTASNYAINYRVSQQAHAFAQQISQSTGYPFSPTVRLNVGLDYTVQDYNSYSLRTDRLFFSAPVTIDGGTYKGSPAVNGSNVTSTQSLRTLILKHFVQTTQLLKEVTMLQVVTLTILILALLLKLIAEIMDRLQPTRITPEKPNKKEMGCATFATQPISLERNLTLPKSTKKWVKLQLYIKSPRFLPELPRPP